MLTQTYTVNMDFHIQQSAIFNGEPFSSPTSTNKRQEQSKI